MDDGGLPGAATDVSYAAVEAQSVISELLRLSHVPDVLKEFERLTQALTASAAEERKLIERNSKVKSELESARQTARESKVC